MPLYTIKCNSCDSEWDEQLTLKQFDEFIECVKNNTPRTFTNSNNLIIPLICMECQSIDVTNVITCTKTKHLSWSTWQIM